MNKDEYLRAKWTAPEVVRATGVLFDPGEDKPKEKKPPAFAITAHARALAVLRHLRNVGPFEPGTFGHLVTSKRLLATFGVHIECVTKAVGMTDRCRPLYDHRWVLVQDNPEILT